MMGAIEVIQVRLYRLDSETTAVLAYGALRRKSHQHSFEQAGCIEERHKSNGSPQELLVSLRRVDLLVLGVHKHRVETRITRIRQTDQVFGNAALVRRLEILHLVVTKAGSYEVEIPEASHRNEFGA